jgi:spore maturation protein CgeB
MVPLDKRTLNACIFAKLVSGCFLSDDPWNIHHRTPWFMKLLPLYGRVFTPRTANEVDLRQICGERVRRLRFGFAPDVHFRPESARVGHENHLVFIGGGDPQRTAMLKSVVKAGLDVELWGGYWSGAHWTGQARGHAEPSEFRRLVAEAGINLCLVRRANRDGHSMRSFELPAVGGVVLAEDTDDHRDIFGKDGAVFFQGVEDVGAIAAEMMRLPIERRVVMADAAHDRVTGDGRHTYAARLATMVCECTYQAMSDDRVKPKA